MYVFLSFCTLLAKLTKDGTGHDWRPYISGIVLGDPIHLTGVDLDMDTLAEPESLTVFISTRCIAYVLSTDQLGTLQSGYGNHGCNCYSAGEALNIECILPSAWPHMLSWLDKVHKDPEYAEQIMIMDADVEDEMSRAVERLGISAQGDDQVGGEDSEGRIAAEECKADDVEARSLFNDGKSVEGQLKQENVTQDVRLAGVDEVLGKAQSEHVEVRVKDAEESK